MVRHRLDSISDCARSGYNLRITCLKCDHIIEVNAVLFMQQVGPRIAKMPLDKFEDRARCTACGHRGAHTTPCEINF